MKAMGADGMSLTRIANQLNTDKVPTKRGARHGSDQIVQFGRADRERGTEAPPPFQIARSLRG